MAIMTDGEQVGGAPTPHDLGGAKHIADTLANLNSKVSDATLDDSGDSRAPTQHGLGSALHSSATLAQLNALVSDATLDDASDSRTPSAHDLGGALHNSATLAQLEAKISNVASFAALSATPTINGSIPTYQSGWVETVRAWNLGAATSGGISLINTTDADVGTPEQWSPAIIWGGEARNTSGGASETNQWRAYVQTFDGNPTYSSWCIDANFNGAGWNQALCIDGDFRVICSNLRSYGFVQSGTTFSMHSAYNYNTGLGSSGVIWHNANTPLVLSNAGRDVAAGNIAHARTWDVNAASINDYAIIDAIGWTNNADAFTNVHKFYPKHYYVAPFTVAQAPATPPLGSIGICSNGATGAPCVTVGDGANWKVLANIAGLSNISAT